MTYLLLLLAIWAQVPVLLPVLLPSPVLIIGACIAVVELLAREWQQDRAALDAEPESDEPEDAIEDWHIAELARACRAAHNAGNREVRDLLERVLEDIAPWWRAYT
jgi:hypothetical protein